MFDWEIKNNYYLNNYRDKYNTWLDFLVGELFDLRKECFAYYNEKGKKFRDIFAARSRLKRQALDEALQNMDELLMQILHLAVGWKSSGGTENWEVFKGEVRWQMGM